jgi:hypothetical protein
MLVQIVRALQQAAEMRRAIDRGGIGGLVHAAVDGRG